MLEVRRYAPQDLYNVIDVFIQAIRQIASADYDPEQIEAWSQADPDVWSQRCESRPTWVAVINQIVVGFTEFEQDGHLAMMYVHPRYAGQGVAKTLLRTVEAYARDAVISCIFAEASITARPFFERNGFELVEREQVMRNGQLFDRFKMRKQFPDGARDLAPQLSADVCEAHRVAAMPLANRVKLEESVILADDWSVLRKNTFSYLRNDGTWQRQSRETYDRGNGATMLLYDLDRRTVLLTKQFRYAAFVNGHDDLLIETPAGLLDAASPESRIRAEVEEETGYKVKEVRQIFDVFMSPGSVTERLYFFVGAYSAGDQVAEGGGIVEEGEDIERLELTIDEALNMIEKGQIKDGKTIMLLQYAALYLFKS
ncbi:GNAT family N-acetyltransferase [Stutzerimonas zhaodongensis]|uniref:GNAT family N-acetyltransferase n=1 Tax=Stutzerimonas TaxID=2901164 RepID=UPI003890B2F4